MATARHHKKNLIVSYKNLSDDLKELFKEIYPEGYSNYLQKFVKPNGEPIFVVPLETDDTAYMVKFDVKIDTLGESDDLDKDIYGNDEEKDEEFAPISEALDKEENNTSHTERHLRHGDFEDSLGGPKKKISLDIDKEELKAAFADDDSDIDSYDDDYADDEMDNDDEYEPSAEDIQSIEDEFLDAENPPLDATIPDEELAAPLAKKASKSTKKAATPKAKATKSASKSKSTKKQS